MNPKLLVLVMAATSAWTLCAEATTTSITIPDGTSEELRDALKWYASLDLPSSRGLARVRVTNTYSKLNEGITQTSHLDAWVVDENPGMWRLHCGPDAPGPFWMSADTPWPLEEWTTRCLTHPLGLTLRDQAGWPPDGFHP